MKSANASRYGGSSSLVVALNPSVDVEWQVPSIRWEEKNVIDSERRWPGGKGVNVARWLKFLGAKTTLLLPIGGNTEIQPALLRENIGSKFVPIAEPTRANYIVTSSRGQLRFNPPGPRISTREWKTLLDVFERELRNKTLVILSGSLPRGLPVDAYRQILEIAHGKQVQTILDCDGAPFHNAVAAKPFLVKPNEYELSSWAGEKIVGVKRLVTAARKLATITGGWVLVSRGKNGAVLLNAADQDYFAADAPKVQPFNTVGAGDAMLAAVAQQIQADAAPAEWLRWGVAVGSAATQCRAGELPKIKLVRQFCEQTSVSLRAR